MTKEQELAVLNEIVKLIESAGEDSYIKAAFDGCIEDARSNIENDFMLNWKQRAEASQELCDGYSQALEDAVTWRDIYKDRAEKAEEAARNNLEIWEEADERAFKAETELKTLRQEVIELKARLYDYMIKG